MIAVDNATVGAYMLFVGVITMIRPAMGYVRVRHQCVLFWPTLIFQYTLATTILHKLFYSIFVWNLSPGYVL